MSETAANDTASAREPERFDYSSWQPELAEYGRGVAERIRRHERHRTQGILASGAELLAMKERLPHGEFGKWIAAELDMSPRAAQHRINAAAMFADKSETVSYLPARILYSLSARNAPKGAVDEVLQRFIRGERPTARQIRVWIYDARHFEKTRADATKRERNLKRQRALAPLRERNKFAEATYKGEMSRRAAQMFGKEFPRQKMPEFYSHLKRGDFDTFLTLVRRMTESSQQPSPGVPDGETAGATP